MFQIIITISRYDYHFVNNIKHRNKIQGYSDWGISQEAQITEVQGTVSLDDLKNTFKPYRQTEKNVRRLQKRKLGRSGMPSENIVKKVICKLRSKTFLPFVKIGQAIRLFYVCESF